MEELTFKGWMSEVDRLLVNTTGLTSEYFAFFNYHDSYMTIATPQTTAQVVLFYEFGDAAPPVRCLSSV